ncbi:MAG: DNA recombination/repair protein RecA, partial [Candidatus Cloacimonadaceae bacterium]
IEGNMGDSHVGLQARLMSQALRKLTAIVSKSNTAVVFINQTRMKIGTPSFVNPETTTGGVALKFYSSLRLEVRFGGSIKEGGTDTQVIGARTKVKVVKNKFAPPFKTVDFPIIFGQGISHLDIILDMASAHDIVKRSGSWYSYGDIKLGQGADKTKIYLTENPDLLEEIEGKLRAKINPEEFTEPVSPDEAEILGED